MFLTAQMVSAERRVVGDMNTDGVVDIQDIVALVKELGGKNVTYSRVADVNHDKKVDKYDVEQLAKIILEKAPFEYYEHIDGGAIEEGTLKPGEEWD